MICSQHVIHDIKIPQAACA